MTRPARDRFRLVRLLAGRARALLAGGTVLVAIAVAAVLLTGRADSPALSGTSPPLPSTYRPGSGIGPVSLGESRRAVIAAVGRSRTRLVRGSLVVDRPGGLLAVGFRGDRVARLLATGRGSPFGQRLAAEETTLSSWRVELCRRPARLLLVAPDGRTYFVFATALAGLGAVGVSTARVRPCGPLG